MSFTFLNLNFASMGCVSSSGEAWEDTFELPASLMCGVVNKKRQQILDILRHPQLAFLYREWLRSALSYESLLFYLDVEDYKRMVDPEERRERATAMYEKFFSDCSEFEISVESSIRQTIRESLRSQPEPDLFNIAQVMVLLTLEEDTLGKFISCPLYTNFVTNPINRKVFLGRLPRTRSYFQLQSFVDRNNQLSPRTATTSPKTSPPLSPNLSPMSQSPPQSPPQSPLVGPHSP